jgi:hypothetical protein
MDLVRNKEGHTLFVLVVLLAKPLAQLSLFPFRNGKAMKQEQHRQEGDRSQPQNERPAKKADENRKVQGIPCVRIDTVGYELAFGLGQEKLLAEGPS